MAHARRRSKGSAGGTPATAALTAAGVPFSIHTYEHDPAVTDYGAEAATELGVDPAAVFKTLMCEADGSLVVGIVPVDSRLDLKGIARAVGAKSARLADVAVAERRTGYIAGGISPLGQKNRHRTVLDDSAMAFEGVYVSGGRRGFDIRLAPTDLAETTGAVVTRIRRKD